MYSIQFHQFINLLFLLFIAEKTEVFYLNGVEVIILLLFSFVIEHIFIYIKEKKIVFFSFSSLTTSMGIMLMLISTQWWIYGVSIILALGQKHFLTLQQKHFFNPSNFALVMVLLLFYNDAHIVLGQLGNERWLQWIILILALFILYRAKRLYIPIFFILSYSIIQYFFIVQSDPNMFISDLLLRFDSVSFIVFIVFMLTDPRTTPAKAQYQILFAISLASMASLFDFYYGFRVQHLFMVLFLLTPLVVFISILKRVKKPYYYLVLMVIFQVLSLAVIISIESHPPYYFEMGNE